MNAPVLDKLAYSLPNFAKAVDVSVSKLYEHIEKGELVPSYPSARPVITRDEGMRWLSSLPSERPNA